MNHHELAHWLGFSGEAFNLVGAIILATDLVFRQRDLRLEEEYSELKRFAEKHNLETATYKSVRLLDPDFPAVLMAQRATWLGIVGVVLLALGFALLAAYHLVMISLARGFPTEL